MSQIRYINNVTGKDIEEYSGSVDRPFKTLSYALTRADDGDELQLMDMSMVGGGIYHEEYTIVLEKRNNLTIRFGTVSAGGKPSGMKWEVGNGETIDTDPIDDPGDPHQDEPVNEPEESGHTVDVALRLIGCNDIKLIGATFICYNDTQTGCIEAIDCNNIGLYSCDVNGFKINSPQEKLFHAIRSTVTFNNITMTDVSNEVFVDEGSSSAKLSFLDISGDSTIEIYSCGATDYYSRTVPLIALHADQDVRSLYVNGFVVHNCESDTETGSVGVQIDADAGSFINFDIRNCQFSNIRNGIIVNDLPPAKKQEQLIISSSTFYKCCRAIVASDSDFTVTNISIYGIDGVEILDDEEEPLEDESDNPHEEPAEEETSAGIRKYYHKIHWEDEDPTEFDVYGIIAKNRSKIIVVNTVVTNCNTCFAAYDISLIDVARTIFCDNTYFKEELEEGEVVVDDYVRATDPCYENIHSHPYGNFKLKNNSPCINGGKTMGFAYSGSAPTIGAIDQDRYITTSDIVSIAARKVRDTETYNITEMDVEGLVVSGLKAMEPDAAADREGSAIRDLFVKPAVELTRSFISELENVRRGMSFLNIDVMTDDDADALAANLIVTRKTGAKATGVIRIYFDKAFNFELPAETMFSTNSGLHFYSINRTSVSKEEMQASFDGSFYYVEVIAEGEEPGATYNIGPGEISVCNDMNVSSMMTVTNESYFSGGESRETNKELYERVKLAITTRCLNTTRGVKYQFLEAFTFLRRLTVIGKGDSEMIRDDLASLLRDSGVALPFDESDLKLLSTTHVGGKTDIYTLVYEPINDFVIIENIPELGTLTDIGLTDKPILRINSIELCDPVTKDTLGVTIPENKWELISNDDRVRFSMREKMSLRIDNEYAGSTVKINYMWVYEISAMQKWTETEDNRVICEDILVKHYQPAFVCLSLGYHAPEEVVDMENLVREFIMSIPEKKSLRVSDLIDYAYDLTAVHVVTPLLLSVTLHKNDGSIERYESFDEVVLERTACFIPDRIECLYLGEDPL